MRFVAALRSPPIGVSRFIGVICLLFVVHSADAQGYDSPQCNVNDPLSCDAEKREVCLFIDGNYKCACPNGVARLPDGRCVSLDECSEPRLHDCSPKARCVDREDGYTCHCLQGYADISPDVKAKPGRICQTAVNECADPNRFEITCDPNSICIDTEDSYTCQCNSGYADVSAKENALPGRKCVEATNECLDKSKNDCSDHAVCEDASEGYTCHCEPGFVDASPDIAHYPGRICNKPKGPDFYGPPSTLPQLSQCDPNNPKCGPNEACVDSKKNGEFTCECAPNAVHYEDGKCRVFSACDKPNDCDRNAMCSNAFDTYKCQCKPDYFDASPDPVNKPGRVCKQQVNECGAKTHDCSPYASCTDTQDGFTCACNPGYTDVSSRVGKQPGRECSTSSNECADPKLNTCDEHADCVDTPDSYTCQCITGFIDVSSSARLPPGRSCSLQTNCPEQATDLVFLVDGSGSIGSYVFRDEVLRFVREFVELFNIGKENTRVAFIQYSDQIRHEFDLNQFTDRAGVLQGISDIRYLTGLTRTGAAIDHMVNEEFTDRRGSRPQSQSVARIAVVITDGRSQDNVTQPALAARNAGIQVFAIGVTDHVMDKELEAIAGSPDRWFHVDLFTDLDIKLRSLIQKLACHRSNDTTAPPSRTCDPATHKGCDRSRNEVCREHNGQFSCGCPEGFDRHPLTHVCGGDVCNPQLITSCPDPEECLATPFGNYRCACPPSASQRDPNTGACTGSPSSLDVCKVGDNSCKEGEECIKNAEGHMVCMCGKGLVRNPKSNHCGVPGSCDPSLGADACDARKKEQCLPAEGGKYYTCQCAPNFRRHSVTGICLIDECASGTHDCHPSANCTDTDEGFLCACNRGFLDRSPEPTRSPGRVCDAERNECLDGSHNCSVNALCVDLPDGFLCRCKPDFVDASPNPNQFGGVVCNALVDECKTPSLNTCHKNALCIDTRESYKCQCKQGFVDDDELRNPGRKCEKINKRCTTPGENDCDANAQCIERGTNEYECICKPGFLDQSPNLVDKPGRACLEYVCIDPTKNDCHPAAICTEVSGPQKYTCRCRDGYEDESKDSSKPGRQCKEQINECLDRALNDCDPLAVCEDQPKGYTCRCPAESIDQSTDASKPGRKCLAVIAECSNPHLHNCSRFADCIEKEVGYECKCKEGYHDNKPSEPGTECNYIINECASANLNDCDRHAECRDTLGGYECECKAPYKDESKDPKNLPGRICRFNECSDPKLNDCGGNSECHDTDDGFNCQCKAGFFDDSTDPTKTGVNCIELQHNNDTTPSPVTVNPDALPCGKIFCLLSKNEVCIGGARCGCRPGQNRKDSNQTCVNVDETQLATRVVGRGGDKLLYTSEYGDPSKPSYVDFVDVFDRGMDKTIQDTPTAAADHRYVANDVNFITHPKTINSSWPDGLLVNFTVFTVPGQPPIDRCVLWDQIMAVITKNNFVLGDLTIAKDVDLLDPCRVESSPGSPCGNGQFCNVELGQVCIADSVCGCPTGMKQAKPTDKCVQVESWVLPLWVVRKGPTKLAYNSSFSDPLDPVHQQYVDLFEKGVGQSYGDTDLANTFVVAEVNEVIDPSRLNASFDSGILYNFTVYFKRGSVKKPSDVFDTLVNYIIGRNNYELGKSELFISPYQPNPFLPCFTNNCNPKAICVNLKPTGYRCECPSAFRDLNPSDPGHRCVPTLGYNECDKPEDNECSDFARCIDEDNLYRCECVPPYVDSATDGALPGSVCRLDFCSDVNFCPTNTTCVNQEERASCVCKKGFVDIRRSEKRVQNNLFKDTSCLDIRDVDECALGLTNCSAFAICTDLLFGYECSCPVGYADGIPEQPGRACSAPWCDLCHGHGDCIHNPVINNITCVCNDGWSGDFCDVAPSAAGLILMLILALLFLLLTLCCLLYFCLKCRCFRKQRLLSESGGSDADFVGSGIGSDYYTIPRAKLKPESRAGFRDSELDAGHLQGYLDDYDYDRNAVALAGAGGAVRGYDSRSESGSESSGGEEFERRVITDVNRTEVRTTTTTAGADTTAQFNVYPPMEEEMASFSGQSGRQQFGSSSMRGGQRMQASSSYSERYEEGSESGDSQAMDDTAEDGVMDRTTRVTHATGWEPDRDGRGGIERFRNEISTSTKMHDTTYR